MTQPEYLHITADPTSDDMRVLLQCMIDANVSELTAKLFGVLVQLAPSDRLALNIRKAAAIMAERRIKDVLQDGLVPEEAQALVELDTLCFPDDVRRTARALLNVKERWIMSKCLGGLFNRARYSNAYISIEVEE